MPEAMPEPSTPPKAQCLRIEQTLRMERLDTFLKGHFPDVSRGTLQRLIEEGHIRVNGHTVKPSHTPKAGDEVTLQWPEARPAEAQPENMPLDVLFEDADLLVINKPAGLVVHPAAGHEEHTLVNALLHHCAGQLSGIGGVARPGIVHRLDKETSGCLVVAKNDTTHLALANQFSGREVTKTYQAIVCGELPRETGEIHAAIARHPTHRKCMAVVDNGREAHTSYRILQRLNQATLVQAALHTGRTHQIRVHFQFLGFPIVGDTVYGRRQNARLKELTRYAAGRQMLHSFNLSFTHPRTGKTVNCTAPLPEDFLAALSALKPGGG
jgi:23S rRNA pseudouridine1911/1915/1917 synthase